MKYIMIIVITIFITSCSTTNFINDNISFIEKGMNEEQVQNLLDDESRSIRTVTIDGVDYEVQFYPYVVAQIHREEKERVRDYNYDPKKPNNPNHNKQFKEETKEITENYSDSFIVTFDPKGEIVFWGMLYEYLREDDHIINALGNRISFTNTL